jgi:protein gp37
MTKKSGIAWTDGTANFWWGCLKVSEGCDHCYAETLSKRVGKDIWGPAKTTQREYKKAIWKDVLKWDKESREAGTRRKVFVQSMSDFLEDHPQLTEWREQAKRLMEGLTNTDILMLTKRPENADRFLGDWYKNWPAHVWFGVTTENQKRYDERIPILMTVPAPVRWLSIEPMIGEVKLGNVRSAIDWIIVGGESGTGCRPFNPDWGRSLLAECREYGIAYFQKQMGGFPDKRHNTEDFPEDLRVREFPEQKG